MGLLIATSDLLTSPGKATFLSLSLCLLTLAMVVFIQFNNEEVDYREFETIVNSGTMISHLLTTGDISVVRNAPVVQFKCYYSSQGFSDFLQLN